MYTRDVNVALIVYDVTNAKSLENVEYWANEVKLGNMEEFSIILVGNKKDLEKERKVSFDEGHAKSLLIGAQLYVECTIMDKNEVQNLF